MSRPPIPIVPSLLPDATDFGVNDFLIGNDQDASAGSRTRKFTQPVLTAFIEQVGDSRYAGQDEHDDDLAAVYAALALKADTSKVSSEAGQCVFSIASSGFLRLDRKNGSNILIDGTFRTIPDGGILIAATGIPNLQDYYYYAYWNGSAIALEYSNVGFIRDPYLGVMVKNGDTSRTLVGWAYKTLSGTFQDDVNRRTVSSWYNKTLKPVNATASGSTTATTPTLVGSTGLAFVWPGDSALLTIVANVTSSAIDTVLVDTVFPGTLQGKAYIGSPNTYESVSSPFLITGSDLHYSLQARLSASGGGGTVNIDGRITGAIFG